MRNALSVLFGLVTAAVLLGVSLPQSATAAGAIRCVSGAGCSEAEALSECKSYNPLPDTYGSVSITDRKCDSTVAGNGSGRYNLSYVGKRANGTSTGWVGFQAFAFVNKCGSEPSYTGVGPWYSGGMASNGSLGCRNNCDGVWQRNVDSSMTFTPTGSICPDNEKSNCQKMSGYYWNPILNVCEPPEGTCPGGRPQNSLGQCAEEPCPEGKVQQPDGTCKNKNNECPAGQIKSPDGKCLPGDGQCAQGEVRGKDGTCKRDSDGDGEPDQGEEGGEDPDGKKKDEFSGGDDCKTPPTCSGSPIMCGQARIQWRIDCNTRRNRNIAGGACNTPPVCTGEKCDAMEYSSLLMQWRTACALERATGGIGGGGGGNGDSAAIRGALTGTDGVPNYGAESPGSGAWKNGGNTPPGQPDTSGYGWGGSCPQPPSFEVMGQSYQFDVTPVCTWLGLGSYFVLGLAALFSLRIVASKEA